MLSVPAFPTQDGPVHLYYTHVLRSLLLHQPTPYAHFYTIKHLVPPYAVYYYALLALSKFVPLLLADRLVVCVYVVSFVLGFRYLARVLGPSADTMTMLSTIVLLNWPLGMGFVNFCLSLSLVFWALGLWLRFSGHRGIAVRIGFVLLAILAMLTHPVPLLALLGLAGLHLALCTWTQRRTSHAVPPFFLPDLLTLGAAALTIGYVKLFTSSHPLQQTPVGPPAGSFAAQLWHNVLNYGAEKGVGFFAGPGFEPRLYRVLLLAVFVIPLALAVRQWLRHRAHRRWTVADAATVLAVLSIVALPLIPHDLNGSHFFADRLLLMVWLLPLFAASGYRPLSPRMRTALLVFALVSQAVILHLANTKVRPLANTMAAIDSAPRQITAPPGALGLALEDPREPDIPPGLTFDPFLWATADVFRHDNAVLANTPWLDLAIIPLGATPALPASTLSPAGLEFPSILRNELNRDEPQRANLLKAVDFVAVNQAFRTASSETDSLLLADPGQSALWTCHTSALQWLRVCTKAKP